MILGAPDPSFSDLYIQVRACDSRPFALYTSSCSQLLFLLLESGCKV
jgi:hypothetical protein